MPTALLDPMHVLLTVNAAWNVRNFRWSLLRALIARGHRVTVLAPPDVTVVEIEAEGARFVPLRMRQAGLGPLDGFALNAQFHRAFAAERPDVVLSWTIKNNIFGAFAARRMRIPFIPNVSGLGTAFLSGKVLLAVARTLYRAAFSGLPTVFFQNRDDLGLFVDQRLVSGSAARLLPGSGLDLARFEPAPLPDGPPVFLMISRLLRDKGAYEFVDAARIVRAARPEVRFRLIGDTAPANRSAVSSAEIEAWQRQGDVEVPGPVADVRPEIAGAHCVVLPSYREGAPRTLIEGAGMARPLIATDVPGCRAVVDHAVTGILCRPRDAGSLADACFRMLEMAPADWVRMGSAGRAKMEREYGDERVVAAYLAAMDDTCP